MVREEAARIQAALWLGARSGSSQLLAGTLLTDATLAEEHNCQTKTHMT